MPESVPDFTTFFERLQAEDCRYVLIGGLAMIAHGSARLTFDLDLSIARDGENVERLVRALAPLQPRPRGFPDELPFVWDSVALRGMTTATLRTTAGDIDLLAEPEGVDNFDGLWSRAVEGEVFGRTVRIASLEDLAGMKKAAGREKDLEDLRYISILLAQRD
jgi:hypothetical protein